MNIWVIDDESEICNILEYLLVREGHQVTKFESPTQALDLFKQSPPEVLICDFKMPLMSGLEFFMKIKDSWSGDFIMLTGEPSADPLELQRIGIKEVLFKPRDLTRILAIISDISKNK